MCCAKGLQKKPYRTKCKKKAWRFLIESHPSIFILLMEFGVYIYDNDIDKGLNVDPLNANIIKLICQALHSEDFIAFFL